MRPLDYDGLLDLDPRTRRNVAALLESDFRVFVRWAFFLMLGAEFEWTQVHELKLRALNGVYTGRIKRLIVNEPPRFSKTEIMSILWPTWCIIKNPACRFMLLSGSDDLVRDSSGRVRSFLERPEIALLWPSVVIRSDTSAKELWRTTQGGGFRAVSFWGQITGFGAGQYKSPVFAGALIIDDANKAQDALSIVKMEKGNIVYSTTARNRLNDLRSTPIVVTAQRLHDSDLSGFLLNGGSGEKWHHLRLPAVVLPDEEEAAAGRYKRDWSYGIPLNTRLKPGFTWPDKYGKEEDRAMRVIPDTWATQYIQNPRITAGAMLRTSWFKRYDRAEIAGGLEGYVFREEQRIPLQYMIVYADTAAKIKEANDYSVFQLWGFGHDNNIYLLDQIRGKWEAPDLEKVSTAWLQKYEAKHPRRYGWREIGIEDKSSGIGLIQALQRKWGAFIRPIPRNKDKVTRATMACLYLESGRVWIPKAAPWVPDFIAEAAAFNKQMTHLHDDQLDPMFDAIENMLHNGGSVFDVVR